MPEDVKEVTLDPEDWEQLKELGHRMVDDMLGHLEHVRDRPIFQRPPPEAMMAFRQPPPMIGMGAAAAYNDFREQLLRHQSNFNTDPRFWGFVVGTGTPGGMLHEMLSAGLNVNVVGGPLASTMLELQVMGWLKGMLGYPMDGSGILVSGGSMANLLGITAARNSKCPWDMRKQGISGGAEMTLYVSEEAHACIQKAVEMLGLGEENMRKIPVDAEYRVDVKAMREAVKADKAAGLNPFCVIGNAGTANTGSVDDLEALADLASQEGLWFHVDGAFGAWAAIVPELKGMVKGMERADSVAFDLHKWMYMPYDVGCVLFRRERDQVRSFSLRPDYFGMDEKTPPQFADYGYELSRSFRALKVWMGIKENGVAKYSALVKQNVDQARYLAELVKAQPELELLAPVPLNIVCFRYRGQGIPEAALDELNHGLLMQLMFSGAGAPSETKINGKFALRACITNHRTRRGDLEKMVGAAVAMGRQMAQAIK